MRFKKIAIYFLLLLLVNSAVAQDYREHLTKLLKEVSAPKLELKRLEGDVQDPLERAIIKNKLGVIYQKEGKLDSAYALHTDALTLAFLHKKNNEEIAISYNKIGIIHYYSGQYDSAAYFFQQSIPYYISPLHKANSLNNLALMYKYQEQPDRSIEAYLEALSIYKKEQEITNEVIVLNNIGSLHFGLKGDSLA